MELTDCEFEDHLPSMMKRLGAEGFMEELCKGFRLLMDDEQGVITCDSLKRNSVLLLGLDQEMGDDEIVSMMVEGDLDGDGAINQMEFCILMFRLSPELIDGSKQVLCSNRGGHCCSASPAKYYT
ncbi:unnamed protein product [Linum trigynum]|uniref:EF-hand domain-containing protein n=1 Tax=Linum trigynum TaxID=586398 RepID=A0AAV2C9R0_9ROSI